MGSKNIIIVDILFFLTIIFFTTDISYKKGYNKGYEKGYSEGIDTVYNLVDYRLDIIFDSIKSQNNRNKIK